jgi:hypothetical protein
MYNIKSIAAAVMVAVLILPAANASAEKLSQIKGAKAVINELNKVKAFAPFPQISGQNQEKGEKDRQKGSENAQKGLLLLPLTS